MLSRYIPNGFNLAVVIFVALGSTACSYGLAVIGSTAGQPSFYKSMGLAALGEEGYSRTAQWLGAFNGLNSAGAALGAVHNAWSADRFSRKHTMQVGAIILITGAALCAGSVDKTMFLIARFVSGWGIGILICVIPMYQSEVSTPETRGFMVSMHGIMFAVGYALSAWVGFGVWFISASGSSSTFPWRFPLAFQILPALILLVGSPWLPYSPRWLMQQDRIEEAKAVLLKLHTRSGQVSGDNTTQAHIEFEQLRAQTALDREMAANRSRWELVKSPGNRKRVMIATILMWGDMFMGPIFVANYGVILFTQLGLKGYVPLMCLSFLVTATFPGNVITALYVDRFGRRVFLLIGCVGITVCLMFETLLQALYLQGDNIAGQRAAVFFIFLYAIFWSTFMDATQYLYLSEIFPTHIRGQGVAVGMFHYFVATVIILVVGPIALDKIGWKFLLVFLIPTACYTVAVYFLFPETCQRSLEDINAQFGEVVALPYYHGGHGDESNNEAKTTQITEIEMIGRKDEEAVRCKA